MAYDGKVAISGINLELQPGTINGLVGPNGGGKSTLFKAIMGFIRPSGGSVAINGLSNREYIEKDYFQITDLVSSVN